MEMNDMLLKEFTAEVVREALNAIGDLKAPGPNAFDILQEIMGHGW